MTDQDFNESSDRQSLRIGMLPHRQGQKLKSNLRDRLNGKIEELLVPFIVNKSEHICIIDPPGHPNIGDRAILLLYIGELVFSIVNSRGQS